MPVGALLLVLCAACLHATWNLLAKRAGGGLAFVWLYGAVTVALYAPVAAWTAWAERPSWGRAEWTAVGASAVIHVVYSLTLQAGYRAADLSVVYPVARGVGPLLTAFGAITLLGERPSPLGAAGIGTIVLGVFVLARGWTLFRGGTRAVGVGWGFGIGMLVASYTLVDGYAVKHLL
ncbi:MAG: EamA family transporter, partial [Myxococcota bacterium]